MKKSTLLSLATAGAIIATSAGTFALWDTTEATNSGTLTVANPVALTTTAATYTESTRTLGTTPEYTADATFNVDKQGQTISKLEVTGVKIFESTDTSKATDLSSKFDITLTANGDSDVTVAGTTLTDTSVEAINTYKVTITPKDDNKDDIKGKTVTVDVAAKIS